MELGFSFYLYLGFRDRTQGVARAFTLLELSFSFTVLELCTCACKHTLLRPEEGRSPASGVTGAVSCQTRVLGTEVGS